MSVREREREIVPFLTQDNKPTTAGICKKSNIVFTKINCIFAYSGLAAKLIFEYVNNILQYLTASIKRHLLL